MDKRKEEILKLAKEALELKKNQKQDAFEVRIVEAEIRKINYDIESIIKKLKQLKQEDENMQAKKNKKKVLKTQEEIEEEKELLLNKVKEQEVLLDDAKVKLHNAIDKKTTNLKRYEELTSNIRTLVQERNQYIDDLIKQDESPVLDLKKVVKEKRIINNTGKYN